MQTLKKHVYIFKESYNLLELVNSWWEGGGGILKGTHSLPHQLRSDRHRLSYWIKQYDKHEPQPLTIDQRNRIENIILYTMSRNHKNRYSTFKIETIDEYNYVTNTFEIRYQLLYGFYQQIT